MTTASLKSISLTELSSYSLTQRCVPCLYDTVTNTVYQVQVPDATLSGLPRVQIRSEADLSSIPNVEGNYWILTDEPVNHCLHAGTKCPRQGPETWVVYNGVSGGLQARAREHLLRPDAKGGFGAQSGISVDLLREPPTAKASSHAKCAWDVKKKIPKLRCEDGCDGGSYKRPTTKEQVLLGLHLSEEERFWASAAEQLYFKNGIHAGDEKHQPYSWWFVYVPIAIHSVRDFIEQEWRQQHGVPVLCSYTAGR